MGLINEKEANGALLPQQMYADDLPVMDIAEYITESRIANAAGAKSTFKQGLGSLI